MFKNSVGRKYLLINKVEDEETEKIALMLIGTIKKKYAKIFERVGYGSVLENAWRGKYDFGM